ncbi:hypothetical protein [Brevundimonas sp. DWR2-3-1b1]|uniref:hypothetical protein n=1 Tax=unclassified Brevundimonas TaxID=2622653 RepID=UPI003CF20A9C
MGKNGDASSARLLAYVLASERTSADHAFLNAAGQLTPAADNALVRIGIGLGALGKRDSGKIKSAGNARPVVQGALAQLALGRPNEAKALAAQLASSNLIWSCLQALCTEHFGVPSASLSDAL